MILNGPHSDTHSLGDQPFWVSAQVPAQRELASRVVDRQADEVREFGDRNTLRLVFVQAYDVFSGQVALRVCVAPGKRNRAKKGQSPQAPWQIPLAMRVHRCHSDSPAIPNTCNAVPRRAARRPAIDVSPRGCRWQLAL